MPTGHITHFTTIDRVDHKRRPFAIFEFRYRTMGEYTAATRSYPQAICSHIITEGLIRESIVPRPEEVIDVEEEYMVCVPPLHFPGLISHENIPYRANFSMPYNSVSNVSSPRSLT